MLDSAWRSKAACCRKSLLSAGLGLLQGHLELSRVPYCLSVASSCVWPKQHYTQKLGFSWRRRWQFWAFLGLWTHPSNGGPRRPVATFPQCVCVSNLPFLSLLRTQSSELGPTKAIQNDRIWKSSICKDPKSK